MSRTAAHSSLSAATAKRWRLSSPACRSDAQYRRSWSAQRLTRVGRHGGGAPRSRPTWVLGDPAAMLRIEQRHRAPECLYEAVKRRPARVGVISALGDGAGRIVLTWQLKDRE